jgi:hypothetical protein
MGELLTPTHRMVVAVVAVVLLGGKRVSAPGRLGIASSECAHGQQPGNRAVIVGVRHQ